MAPDSSVAGRLSSVVVSLTLVGALAAQIPGPNINMVAGTQFPGGDPYLQRQNEPSIAVSTRNQQHLLAGANDYRSVDIPFPPDANEVNGDAWLGLFRSSDGGLTWRSTLLPGFPQDTSAEGIASPLKQYHVATDPTVRAGTHGLIYYTGLAYNRNSNDSGVFVARFQDLNNKEKGEPIAYIDARFLDNGTSGKFLDKPWMAVDQPRPNPIGSANCNINGQQITSGNVYVVVSQFLGTRPSGNPHTQILFYKSTNCGQSWSRGTKLSESFALNQGTVLAIDPGTGEIHVAWRQINNGQDPDAIIYASSTDGGRTFTKGTAIYTFPAGMAFDQASSATQFRTLALPAAAVDPSGRLFVAWAQRGTGPGGDARIRMSTKARGSNAWSAPYVADPTATGRGNQWMPSLGVTAGKVGLFFYDQRNTNSIGVQAPGTFQESRLLVGDLAAGNTAKVFNAVVSDAGLLVRQTVDVRMALVNTAGNATPSFPSVQVSQYKYGSRPGQTRIEQMQFNPPNLPMFNKGKLGFIGDYIDVAGLDFTQDSSGNWVWNTSTANAAVFHTTWTDNRDVRPPPVICGPTGCAQDWTLYTPVASTGGISLYDPTQPKPACVVGHAGTRNQNIYTSRVTEGLVVAFRENSKPLLKNSTPVQRTFAVFVQNNRNQTATYRLTINAPPAGTTASFSQTVASTILEVEIPRKSTIARNVFVNSNQARPKITVTVVEFAGGVPVAGGLQSTATVNPDITNPDITNPDITNPDITNPDITNPDITNPDITNAEIYNPTVTNPDITNPDITSPLVTNPDITNPDITNPDITNPDITNILVTNPDITNPDITNPDITNPDITNPDITNPDISNLSANGGATDFTWKVTNKGNTTVSFNGRMFQQKTALCCPAGCPGGVNCPATCYKCQVVLRRTYPTPVVSGCSLGVEVQNLTAASVPNPAFVTPDTIGNFDNSPLPTNTTMALGPGEAGRLTLRVIGLVTSTPPINLVQPAAVAAGTPFVSLTIYTIELPPALVGVPYNATITSVGGVGPTRAWSLYTGILPPGLTLNPATGVISGTPTATGTSDFGVQVLDSPTPPVQPHVDRQLLSITVNELRVTGVTAHKLGSPGVTTVKAGDSIAVNATVVANGGTATAVSTNLTVNAGGATVLCGAASPASATIAGGGFQIFTYTCGPVSGNGTATFSVSTTGTIGTLPITSPAIVSNGVLVDSTAPSLTATVTANGLPYTPGTWTKYSVNVAFACSDGGSGVAPGDPTGSTTFTTNTTAAGVSATGNCSDNAGNASSLVVSNILIDKDAPVIVFGAATPPANAAGWNNTNVSIPYTIADPLSGVPSGGGTLILSTEGVAVSGVVNATDAAGNSASLTSPVFKIDKTAPGGSFSKAPAANAAGWNKTAVLVTFACTDGLSGVATTPAAINLTSQGANQAAGGTCVDVAGNGTVVNATPTSIDLTSPTINAVTPAPGAVYPVNTNITTSYSCADALSGIASCTGTAPSGVSLSISQVGPLTFVVTATDVAGNSTVTTINYGGGYQFTGFLSPLVALGPATSPTVTPGSSNFGQALPLKWQLKDGTGAFVARDLTTLVKLTAIRNSACVGVPAAGSPSFVLYNPTSGATGGSTFRYTNSNDQYIFNWDTSVVGQAACYNVELELKDGSKRATIIRLQ